MSKEHSNLQGEVLIKDKEELKEPPLYKVVLHNDDYTTMDFVVMILETIFNKDSNEATKIMLDVHNQGKGIAGVYTREIGETKVAQVHRLAKMNEFPLKCSLEKDR
ncbi:ATP-dependent Clp protease adapter ClpS [Desulfogranum japonicum]|uniref:ATP-dependent Clp protease adapter ClpS n=1 Tax=Desulfogranum japonicum TaxID=231447 RepID=UPI00049192F4|nr:ATP-dependent Clp protease adapter ClpS [Desulfogranum japonicum]